MAGRSAEREIEPSAAERRGTVVCFSCAQGRRRGSISFLKNARSSGADKPHELAVAGSSGDQKKRSSPMFNLLRSARHSSNQFASSSTTHRVTRPVRHFHAGGGTKEIRICGRDVLDSSPWEWRKGPTGHVVQMLECQDVTVEDITIRGASHWTVVPTKCDGVTVRNVKLCGGRVQNDDGINPCNSRNVLIEDCLIPNGKMWRFRLHG